MKQKTEIALDIVCQTTDHILNYIENDNLEDALFATDEAMGYLREIYDVIEKMQIEKYHK